MSDAECRKMFGDELRDHVQYQDGRDSQGPTLLFADADYEIGDGKCGLHTDGKYASEPAIVYVRADALSALRAENEGLRKALAPFAKVAELFEDRPTDLGPAGVYSPVAGPEYNLNSDHCRAARAAMEGPNDL